MNVKNMILRCVSLLLLLIVSVAVFGCVPADPKGGSSDSESEVSSGVSLPGVSSSDSESDGVSDASSEQGDASEGDASMVDSSKVSSANSMSSSVAESSKPVVLFPDGKPVKGIARDKFYTLTNKASGKALESELVNNTAPHSVTASISEAASKDTDLQKFQLYETAEGVFIIVCKHNGKALDAGDGIAGTDVMMRSVSQFDRQKWVVSDVGNGYCTIKNVGSGNYLTGSGKITQEAAKGSDSQLWKIDLVNTPDWTLVWSDEFDGPEIDKSVWYFEMGYLRNNELQYYTRDPKNAFIRDGMLVLKAIKEESGPHQYTSASMLTHYTPNRKSWLYGRFEIRARLPFGQAIFPAFWMCGINDPWPQNGEIDIFELYGGKNKDHIIKTGVWWKENGVNTSWGNRTFALPDRERFADKFHTFSCEWDETQIRFYFDGLHYSTLRIETEGMIRGFRQPHFVWLDLAILPNEYDFGDAGENTYPQEFVVDYVRVYQQN